ncbi:MAG: hypothetical protein KGL72_05840 [Actinomycetales bacterium]|nr:hypothetical protein [Actinomycetales bacterium]
MRFLTAAILFVVSATLILVGIAQRTVWHPPANHVSVVSVDTKTPLIVIKSSALRQFEGNPLVSVKTTGKSFIASGRQADVDAWVGSTNHVVVAALSGSDNSKLIATAVAGNGKLANPAGSDLWRTEVNAVGDLKSRIKLSDKTAVLVASDGFADAPTQISLTWRIVFDPTPSNVLIIVGGIMLLAAVILNWLAWYQMRKERGPRRRTPRAPQGPKLRRRRTRSSAPVRGRRSARNLSVAVTGLIVAGSLTGCSVLPGSASPSPALSGATSIQQPPVVTAAQLHTIVQRIASVVALADAGRDSKILATRVSGPAFDSRKAHYILQKASKKVKGLPLIASQKLSLLLPAASNLWPRTVMVISSTGAADNLPQMLVLQQKTPRSQYQLWYNIGMLPGAKLPVVNTPAVGAIPVAADSLFLKIAPNALPTAFGDLIDNGQSSLSAPMFDVSDDEYYKQVAASQQSQATTLDNATIKMKHLLGNPNVISLSTVNSGALVAVFMNDKYVIKPKDRTQAVAVSGNEKLLLGSAGSSTGIKSFYGSMLLFYVPAIASKDKIITLGATQVLLSVKSL